MPAVNPGVIELSLFAPYNDHVSLLSSWNDWKPQPMTRGADGWWRLSVSLADGEYFYKFRVQSKSYFALDQYVEVFDPYGLSVTDDEHERTFLSVKNGNRQWVEYEWKHDDKPLPTNDQLVIYELHVGDFTGGLGDEAGAIVKCSGWHEWHFQVS